MTVNNVNALLNYATPQTGQPEEALKQDELTRSSFGQVMMKVNDTIKSLQTETAGIVASAAQTAEAAETVTTDKSVQTQETDKVRANDSAKTEDAMKQNDNNTVENTDANAKTEAGQEKAVEEVEKSAKELVQEVAKELDVTPEEVEEAMAVLGLTLVDLFDTGNLKQLMLTVIGSEDELTLVTDEALYDNMQNLFAVVEETLESLQEELGLSEEELGALLEQIAVQSGEAEADAEELPVQETVPAEQESEQMQTPEVNLEGMKDYTVSVQKDGETVQVKVTVDDESGAKSVQEKVTDAPKEEIQTVHKTRERNDSADNGKGESSQAGNANANAFLEHLDKPEQTTETPAPISAGYQSAQTQDIMNQIVDYMRINLKADMQEMHLQLHPASLGTVNVQIAAKDGMITAQFTTQNDTVRAVIETQLIQLKQQFEEQGIKVDAVEVTVANHEYGRQFSQENESANEQAGKSAKGTRRINLDEIDEEADLEQMEESERIAVEMMQANGSTIDFTA